MRGSYFNLIYCWAPSVRILCGAHLLPSPARHGSLSLRDASCDRAQLCITQLRRLLQLLCGELTTTFSTQRNQRLCIYLFTYLCLSLPVVLHYLLPAP